MLMSGKDDIPQEAMEIITEYAEKLRIAEEAKELALKKKEEAIKEFWKEVRLSGQIPQWLKRYVVYANHIPDATTTFNLNFAIPDLGCLCLSNVNARDNVIFPSSNSYWYERDKNGIDVMCFYLEEALFKLAKQNGKI